MGAKPLLILFYSTLGVVIERSRGLMVAFALGPRTQKTEPCSEQSVKIEVVNREKNVGSVEILTIKCLEPRLSKTGEVRIFSRRQVVLRCS